jgi:hypothetical protein
MSICDIDDEPCDEPAQIEAAVEAIGEAGQVNGRVLGELERVVRARQTGLEITIYINSCF